MNPAWQGKLDAIRPFVPLNQCDPLPWEEPLDRLAYYKSRKKEEEKQRVKKLLWKSRRAMWQGLRQA